MAAALAKSGDSCHLYECQICLNDMLDKQCRILPCGHYFCHECLERLVKQRRIKCPTCRKEEMLPDGGLDQLPLNYSLSKFRDREKEIHSSAASKCTPCFSQEKTVPAIFACTQCFKAYCYDCKMKHDSIPLFSKHDIHEISAKRRCQIHGEQIVYACTECFDDLCSICVVANHQKHEKHLEKLLSKEEAVKSVEKKVLENKQQITTMRGRVKQFLETLESNEDILEKLKEAIVNQYIAPMRAAEVAAKRVDGDIAVVEKKNDIIDTNSESVMEKVKEITCQLDSISTNLQSLFETQIEYPTESVLMNIIKEYILKLENFDTSISFPESAYSFQQQPSKTELVKVIINIEGRVLKTPCCLSKGYNNDSAHVLLADCDHRCAYSISAEGNVTATYRPQRNGYKHVTAVYTHGDFIYVADEKGITKFLISNNKMVDYNIVNISWLTHMMVVDEDTIILSNSLIGKIYAFCEKTRETKLLYAGLGGAPLHLSFHQGTAGNIFFVSETRSNRILMFNNEWSLCGEIPVSSPGATVVTPCGHLLAARSEEHLISLYTLKGEFIRNILSREDGLEFPVGLAYNPPYLWVSQYKTDKSLRCYRIYF